MSGETENPGEVLGYLEGRVVKLVQKSISSGKDDQINKMREHYGVEGLEEYLIGAALDDAEEPVLDSSVARKYYNRSANKGHALGLVSMALIYLEGTHGVEKDEKNGVKLMKLSANKRCARALYHRAMWLLEGTMGHEKNPQKAYKLLMKAKKDPAIESNAGSGKGFKIYCELFSMRLNGNGCTKSPESAQEYLKAAERLRPGTIPAKIFDMVQLLVGLSPASQQRESDLRWRRLKVALRHLRRAPLSTWAHGYAYLGLPFSVSPSSTGDDDLVVNYRELQDWMIKVGCVHELPEEYPAKDDPLPPLECENNSCSLDETQLEGAMKKCSECQAPYCSEACQRADWPAHKPTCNLISARMNENSMTDEQREYIQGVDFNKFMKDEGIHHLSKIGFSQNDFEKELSRPATKCEHVELGTPCTEDCIAVAQEKHKFPIVAGKKLTGAEKAAAVRLGFKIPTPLD